MTIFVQEYENKVKIVVNKEPHIQTWSLASHSVSFIRAIALNYEEPGFEG
jgi:hypothetical protein